MGIDPIMLAMANGYTDSQQLARIEKKTHKYRLTFDELIKANIIEKFEMVLLKLSDDVIDLTKAVSARLAGESENNFVSDTVCDKLISGQQDGMTVILEAETETMLAISSVGPESETTLPAGLWYVLGTSTGTFAGIKWFEFSITTETIHPIDPKFIPGAPLFDLTEMGLPTVELGSMAMVENIDVSEISAAMDAGNIKIKTLVNIDGVEMDVYANLLSAYLPAAQAREATTVLSFDGKIYAVILTVAQSYINFAVSEV